MQAQQPQIDSVELILDNNLPDVILNVAEYFRGRETEVEANVRHKERVWKARKVKGGWEAWLLVELAIMLDDESSMVFSREEAIYNDPLQLIDLWGEPIWDRHTQQASRDDTIGIELKCEYESRAENDRHSPRTAFLKDVEKVLAGIKPECRGKGQEYETRGTTIYCIAVTTKERDLHDLGYQAEPELMANVASETFYHTKILDEVPDERRGTHMLPHEGHEELWLLWWACHFPRSQNVEGTIVPAPATSGSLPPAGTFSATQPQMPSWP